VVGRGAFTFSLYSSDSQKHIDYLEKQFLEPLMEMEKKTGKIIVPNKDRKILEKIYGIIETNATYLTSDNSIAGK
jgi:phosphorylcholine metabolism protein LicD